MALPNSYLTSTRNLQGILDAIRSARAPEKFSTRFLESLDFKSSSDRLIIGVLKALDFLDSDGKPQDRYFRFLDDTQYRKVLAEGVRDAYSDLFQVNKKANDLSKQDVVNKFKTLSQGQFSESVLDKMATTFTHLSKIADFSERGVVPEVNVDEDSDSSAEQFNEYHEKEGRQKFNLGGVHYNIQIVLPPTRDPQVYDAIFRSLKEHLI